MPPAECSATASRDQPGNQLRAAADSHVSLGRKAPTGREIPSGMREQNPLPPLAVRTLPKNPGRGGLREPAETTACPSAGRGCALRPVLPRARASHLSRHAATNCARDSLPSCKTSIYYRERLRL